MMKKIIKKAMPLFLTALIFCTYGVNANATQAEDAAQKTVEENQERQKTALTFEIEFYTYEILPEATQEDMPKGFTLGDWEYNGVAVKAGFTDNSPMVCVMGEDWETGYQYRFIYDPEHDMFVPYFGTEIKNGYIYTIPVYEGAEIPYGFEEAYFLIQTVPMTTYKRMDAELTQEEIALGVLSDDNYLVFLMMDESGAEVHYTYDLIDRTFQRALLQKKDAETVTELNEVIDKLHSDIGELNATNTKRMNQRLTIIGVLIVAVVIMAGVIINLMLKISKLKKGEDSIEEFDDSEEEPVKEKKSFFKKNDEDEEDDFFENEEFPEENEAENENPEEDDDELEILDLDEV